jgi:hypothetical protein
MAKKQVNKVSDKLSKVSDSFSVNICDNGFLVDISGRDTIGDYKSVKLLCINVEQLAATIQEITEMPRDE